MLFERNILIINDKTISFEHKIKKVISLGEMEIVLLEEILQSGEPVKSNLFSYSQDGGKIWEAKLTKERTPSAYDPKARLELYYDVGLDGDKIYAYTPSWIFILDPKTGGIKETHVNRFG
jgi:hypothetical protein